MNVKQGERVQSGFSLVEALIVVAALGVVASIAAVAVSRSREGACNAKLAGDVQTLNRAIQVYRISGGDLGNWGKLALSNPQAVIDRLKSVALDRDTVVGIAGRMIDPRLEVILQSAEEAKTDQPRAVWDENRKQFVIVGGGGRGIRKFALNTALAADWVADNYEERIASMRFASRDLWVWDYQDRLSSTHTAPTSVGMTPGTSPTPSGAPAGFKVLKPPRFSFKSGSYALEDFDLPLELDNPNKAGISVILYRVQFGAWKLYDGTPIDVPPGALVTAVAKPVHPDWLVSPFVSQTYTAEPVELVLDLRIPAAVSYAEAGGAMIPGAIDFSSEPAALIALANAAEIPLALQSSGKFNVFWTYDGSDPYALGEGDHDLDGQLTGLAPGLHMGEPFADGFPGQAVEYALPLWGSSKKLPVKAVARSYSEHLEDSKVARHEIEIAKVALRNPRVTLVSDVASIDLVTAFGDVPAGARIFYTTDGRDPKETKGLPVTGTEYTGPFSLRGLGSADVTVKARVFGPAGFEHWFDVSEVASTTVTIAPAVMSFSHTASLSAP